MNISDYKFNIGDEVVTIEGERGTITCICDCQFCFDRGFFEPIWTIENGGREDYITISQALNGFENFYKIGSYRFNDFDKVSNYADLAYYENEIKKLKHQLRVIEEVESNDYEANKRT